MGESSISLPSWTRVYEVSLLICPLCVFEKKAGDVESNGSRSSRWEVGKGRVGESNGVA